MMGLFCRRQSFNVHHRIHCTAQTRETFERRFASSSVITPAPCATIIANPTMKTGADSACNGQVPARTLVSKMTNGSSTNGTMDTDSEVMKLAKKFNRFYYGAFRRNECKPLYCDGSQIGLVRPDVEQYISEFPEVFQVTEERITVHPQLQTFKDRSEKIDKVLRELREKNVFVALRGWRNENYEIKANYADPPLFRMERSATCMFGLRQYGIDINGYTHHPELGLCMWFQRRSKSKPTWPGMLDNFVAGGLSEGFSVMQTAIKEAEEEANVPEETAIKMNSAGCVSFFFESERGVFPQTEFVFDLELPADFIPSVNDGEVEQFELVPVDQVLERLFQPDVKTTSCPIAIDFLVRKGIINPLNEPKYPELVENLHIPVHRLYKSASNPNV